MIKPLPLICLALLALAPCLHAQSTPTDPEIETLKRLIAETDSQISDALSRYNALLESSQEQKLKLVQETNGLETAIVALKQQQRRDSLNAAQWESKTKLAQESVENQKGQANYIDGVLADYLDKFENRTHFAEHQSILESILESREALRNPNLGYESRIAHQLEIVALGISNIRSSIGGKRVAGNAIAPDGSLTSGSFAIVGSTAYFSSQDHSLNGIARYNTGTIEPAIHSISGAEGDAIAELLTNSSAAVPIDATEGKALSLEKEKGNLWTHVQKGGWVGYSILALGAVCIFLSLAKAIELQRNRPQTPPNLASLANDAKTQGDTFLDQLGTGQTATRQMLGAGIRYLNASKELREEAMLSCILEYKLKMERALPFIAVTAATAPLLGLLGTVVGMIKTFTLITIFGTGDAKSLSGGISEALITTELGLIVAIPALIVHSMLARKVKANTSTLERTAFEFIKSTES